MSNAAREMNLKLSPEAADHIANSRMVRRFFSTLYNSDQRRNAERVIGTLCGREATIRIDGSVLLRLDAEWYPASTQQMMNCRSWMIENGDDTNA